MRFRSAITVLFALGMIAYAMRHSLVPYLPPQFAALLDAGVTAPDTGQKPSRSRQPSLVVVAVAEEGVLPVQRATIGRIVPVDQTAVGPLSAGIVTEIAVQDGARVKKGDLLVRLDDQTARATLEKSLAEITKDQAVLDDAKRTLERIEKLVASGVNSAQAGDDQRAAVRSAEATLGAARAQYAIDQVALSRAEIKAPFDGQLGAVTVSVGAYIAPGTGVVSITRMKPVYAEFALPESDVALARRAFAAGTLTATLRPISTPDGTEVSEAEGPVVFIDNLVDPATATFTMRAQLENDAEAFLPGQSVDVKLTAGTSVSAVLVPSVAVAERDSGPVVFVVGADDKVSLRPVSVLLTTGQVTALASGLTAGEKVVIEGQLNLEQGSQVRLASDDAPEAAATSPDAMAPGG
jgi:membrane fusion protein, multidrug efflux system